MSRFYYHVAPRYTCGSPAMVDARTALNAALSELGAYRNARTDWRPYDPDEAAWADRHGIERIVYTQYEHGNTQWVFDELSGRVFHVPNALWTGRFWYSRPDWEQFLVKPGDIAPTPVKKWRPLMWVDGWQIDYSYLIELARLDVPHQRVS